MSKILIKNGRIIDPANKIDAFGDLLIENSKIVKVGNIPAELSAGANEIDASGKIVAPGLIDIHVHTREPGQEEKETIATKRSCKKEEFAAVVVARFNHAYF